jgi:hypothetical protein
MESAADAGAAPPNDHRIHTPQKPTHCKPVTDAENFTVEHTQNHCKRQLDHKPKPALETRQRSQYRAAADEDSDDSSESSCDESDENAQETYRQTILGIRNRTQASHQMRAVTTPCTICAQFAKFVQSFI